MLSLVFCTLFLGAMAMPYSPDIVSPAPPPSEASETSEMSDRDTRWAALLRRHQDMDDISPLPIRFPSSVPQASNEYKITMPLSQYYSDFEEKDIVVKAREGKLMVQAVHKSDSRYRYLGSSLLPDNVNVTGNWIFENGDVKIFFPLKEAAKTEVTTETVVMSDSVDAVNFKE